MEAAAIGMSFRIEHLAGNENGHDGGPSRAGREPERRSGEARGRLITRGVEVVENHSASIDYGWRDLG